MLVDILPVMLNIFSIDLHYQEESSFAMAEPSACVYICRASARPPAFLSTTPLHSLQLWKECVQQSCKTLNGYRSLNVVNALGQIRNSSCQDCLSQSEAFPPLSPGRSTVKPGA